MILMVLMINVVVIGAKYNLSALIGQSTWKPNLEIKSMKLFGKFQLLLPDPTSETNQNLLKNMKPNIMFQLLINDPTCETEHCLIGNIIYKIKFYCTI